ncbi:hypothetical protein ACFX2A_022671 [Malus domestica]
MLVHQSSTDAASSLLVIALNEGRDVIMDGTLSWLAFVEHTIDMARDVHNCRYRMEVGYKVEEDGTVTENYWERVDEEEDHQDQQKMIDNGEEPRRKPYRIELVGVADVEADVAAAGVPKKRTFKKFSFRGVDLDALLDMSTDELVKLFPARARRRFQRGLKRKPMALIKKLRKAKREAPPGEKPEPVRTHLRNMIIVPEMIGSIIGVYNGKTFNQVEIKPEMISHYLAEFSISYKPVKHGRPGIGATHSSRFIPLK